MKTLLLALILATPATADEAARWQAQAARVTITRDDWGIAHIHGKSDADAVFGMIYAQAEDDFPRLETNLINAQGRLAEAEGEGEAAIWQDLRMKLFIDPADLKRDYADSPAWLKSLMVAWADGLNFYLAKHPAVKPRVITRFESWMALAFSEGSIGGDIESVSLSRLATFYGGTPVALNDVETGRVRLEPAGSNGVAIGPSHSADGHALLLINPHTSFFFRSEAQVTSDAGHNVYGASTWGQFFTYQGFNATLGWMHPSSGADVIDEFTETTRNTAGRIEYRFGNTWKPIATRTITIPYRDGGTLKSRRFTTYSTLHGPVVRSADGHMISVALMNKPLAALEQSWLRTRASDVAAFMKVGELHANSSNNTILADSKGAIAYLHPQFVPRRDRRFDYAKPVDGSDPATAWQGEHALSELPTVVSPANGWVMNVNDSPWHAAGADSPRQADYPRYMDEKGDNPRTPHMIRVLTAQPKFTPGTLLTAAYDPWMPAFSDLIPTLVAAYDRLPADAAQRASLAGPIAALRDWDCKTGETSVPMTLAVFWGDALVKRFGAAAKQDDEPVVPYLVKMPTDADRIAAFGDAVDRLNRQFGSWQTPWGQVNRFQRLTGDLVQPHDDKAPSVPIGLGSAQWGALASFGSRPSPGTNRWYGSYGNSFVAVVDFGTRVKAMAISAGGESGDPRSPHFTDQVERYRTHDFRPVYFWPDELKGHVARVYRPGE